MLDRRDIYRLLYIYGKEVYRELGEGVGLCIPDRSIEEFSSAAANRMAVKQTNKIFILYKNFISLESVLDTGKLPQDTNDLSTHPNIDDDYYYSNLKEIEIIRLILDNDTLPEITKSDKKLFISTVQVSSAFTIETIMNNISNHGISLIDIINFAPITFVKDSFIVNLDLSKYWVSIKDFEMESTFGKCIATVTAELPNKDEKNNE